MAAGKPANSAANTVLLSKNRNCTVEKVPQLQYFWRKVEFTLYKKRRNYSTFGEKWNLYCKMCGKNTVLMAILLKSTVNGVEKLQYFLPERLLVL